MIFVFRIPDNFKFNKRRTQCVSLQMCNMKERKKRTLYASVLMLIAATAASVMSCSDDNDEGISNDQEKPKIEDGSLPNPIDCQRYKRGDVILVRYTFADNVELGNYNIEVHNNFDHHSHSTSAGDCPLDDKKSPVKPWVYNQDQAIPDGQKIYETDVRIAIPEDIDTGDYHFMIRVTDKAGWQELKAISIKITE